MQAKFKTEHMKNIFITLGFIAIGTSLNAQIDISLNPVSILFSSIDASAEFLIKEDIGMEATLSYNFNDFSASNVDYKTNGFGIRAIGKYYFNPDKGCDKWSIGPYMKYAYRSSESMDGSINNTATYKRFAVGFYTGYKWVSRKNIIFELGFGLGRAFLNEWTSNDETLDLGDFPIFNLDGIGRLSIGYRFGGNK